MSPKQSHWELGLQNTGLDGHNSIHNTQTNKTENLSPEIYIYIKKGKILEKE